MINYHEIYSTWKMPARSRLVPFDLQDPDNTSIYNTVTRYDRPEMQALGPITHVPIMLTVLLANFALSLYVLISEYDRLGDCGNSEYVAAAYVFVLVPAGLLYSWLVEWLQIMTRDDNSERVQIQKVAAKSMLENMTADWMGVGGVLQIITVNVIYNLGSNSMWMVYTYMGILSLILGAVVWAYGLFYWFFVEVKE